MVVVNEFFEALKEFSDAYRISKELVSRSGCLLSKKSHLATAPIFVPLFFCRLASLSISFVNKKMFI
jgi:hypothetical protein